MRRFRADLGWALAGLLGIVIVTPIWLVTRIRPSDREAYGLALIAWLMLMFGLAVTFGVVWR